MAYYLGQSEEATLIEVLSFDRFYELRLLWLNEGISDEPPKIDNIQKI